MIIVFGLQYFAMQSKEMGLPKLWTESSLIIFLTIVVSIALYRPEYTDTYDSLS